MFPAIQPIAGRKQVYRRKSESWKESREREERAAPGRVNRLIDKEKSFVSKCNSFNDGFVKLLGDAEKWPEEVYAVVFLRSLIIYLCYDKVKPVYS